MNKCISSMSADFLEIKISGIVDINDILSQYATKSNDEPTTGRLKVLIDCRKTKLIISLKEMDNYHSYAKKVIDRFHYFKAAIVVDKPYETAIAMLLSKPLSNLKNHFIGIFCTERAATDWLT